LIAGIPVISSRFIVRADQLGSLIFFPVDETSLNEVSFKKEILIIKCGADNIQNPADVVRIV